MPQLPLIYVMVCCNCIAAGSGQCTAVGRGSSAWPMLTVPPNNFNCSTTYMIGLMFLLLIILLLLSKIIPMLSYLPIYFIY